MDLLIRGQPGALVFLLILLVNFTSSQDPQSCLSRFQKGKDNFIIDTDESVKDGATFLSAPSLGQYRDCVVSCCKEPRCNVAVMEKGDQEGSIKSCFLFDCRYKQKYVCRFAKKDGFFSYVSDDVYENHLKVDTSQNLPDRPPVANAGPDKVVQPKESVTLNGMQSRDDKGISSYDWQMLTNYPSAVIEKTTFPDEIKVSNLTSGKYKFQLTVMDTSGQADTTVITVLVLTPEESEHHCMAPMKTGPCRGSFPRWHYNAASGNCEEFMFGGCKENRNNYLTKDECTNACYGSGRSSRLLPVTPDKPEKCGAPCTAEQFTCNNGCCLVNGLECDGEPQCSDGSDKEKCIELGRQFEVLTQIQVDEQKVRCTEHPDTGTCREGYTKWYYDPMQQECVRFNYGGCGGNDNRFDTEDSCKSYCRGVTKSDVFAGKRIGGAQGSDNESVPFVIAIVLGVAILVLLAVLGYCFLKKRRSQHTRLPATHVSAMDRDHLVYNSTTKPI